MFKGTPVQTLFYIDLEGGDQYMQQYVVVNRGQRGSTIAYISMTIVE